MARHVFNWSVARSLAQRLPQILYWTPVLELRQRRLSPTLRHRVARTQCERRRLCTPAALLALALVTGEPLWAAVAPQCSGLSLYANRGLLAAFHHARGLPFALAAGLYYLLVYPLPVGAGATASLLRYPRLGGTRGAR